MDNTTIIITMASVLVGFLCVGGSFASFMYGKSKKQVWTLFSLAVLFLTIVPVGLAVFVAA